MKILPLLFIIFYFVFPAQADRRTDIDKALLRSTHIGSGNFSGTFHIPLLPEFKSKEFSFEVYKGLSDNTFGTPTQGFLITESRKSSDGTCRTDYAIVIDYDADSGTFSNEIYQALLIDYLEEKGIGPCLLPSDYEFSFEGKMWSLLQLIEAVSSLGHIDYYTTLGNNNWNISFIEKISGKENILTFGGTKADALTVARKHLKAMRHSDKSQYALSAFLATYALDNPVRYKLFLTDALKNFLEQASS